MDRVRGFTPCTVFDKWQLIPVLDERDHVVELVRTFF